jgi:hypothetical protein
MSFSLFFMIISIFDWREYSWWSTHPTEMAVIAFVFFTILIIAIGTMVVCLTQLISSGMILWFSFQITSNPQMKTFHSDWLISIYRT